MCLLFAMFFLTAIVKVARNSNSPDIVALITDISGLTSKDLLEFPRLQHSECTYDVSQGLYLYNNNRRTNQKAASFPRAYYRISNEARAFISKAFDQATQVARGEIQGNVADQNVQNYLRQMTPSDCTDVVLSFPKAKKLGNCSLT